MKIKSILDFLKEKNLKSLQNKKKKFKKKNSNELEGEEKEKFIRGAEIAYETIITAFAKGDKKSLKTPFDTSEPQLILIKNHL